MVPTEDPLSAFKADLHVGRELMIRATIISAADQALLSALNFGLAVLLIHFASKPDYGLYSQLMNLQSFFSPFHAGIFASAYLALASKMDDARHRSYRTAMARAEVAMTAVSVVLVVAICWMGSKIFWPAFSAGTCAAFGVALLGLWWREFVRQMSFASLRYDRALNVDVMYVLVTAVAATTVLAACNITTSAVFWCMAMGGIVAAAAPLASAVRGVAVVKSRARQDVLMSWKMGRWDVLGSVVTWAYAQSYIYFAALHGGLDAAAEISAGRLLAAPLALMWASYANVLRPNASRLLASGSRLEIRKLATRSALFVAGSSLLYAIVVLAVIPVLNQSLFGGKFEYLRPLTMWWIVYFMFTGISTVASSVLRSALEFRQVFHRQVLSCIAAVVLLTIGLRLAAIEALVIALVIVEAISASLFWHRLNITVSLRPKSA
jgi:O-antigen/teichoic acid export membrane protein